MGEFDGQIVLVTGGTRGIGRACAETFARRGASVAICGRNADTASEAAATLATETGGTVRGYGCDIANREAVDELIASADADLGAISVLVNNAGLTQDGLLLRMKDEHWDTVIQANLSGAFYTCRAVCRGMMKARYGRIVNLSSIVGLRGQGGQTNYAAAKAGVVGLTKSIAQELAPRNITANVVAPGYIETDMTSGFDEKTREALLAQIPAGRSGTPQEIADAVAFLASPSSGYITGHVLCVDGGLGM